MHRLAVKMLSLITLMTLLLDLAASSKGSPQSSPDVTISKIDSSSKYYVKLDIEEIIFVIVLCCICRAILWLVLQLFLLPDPCLSLIRGYRSVKQRVYHFFQRVFLFLLDFAYEHRQLRRRPAILQGMRPDIVEGQRQYASRNPNHRTLMWEDSAV